MPVRLPRPVALSFSALSFSAPTPTPTPTPTILSAPTTIARRPFTPTATIMGKQEWMVIIPDKAGALEARMKIRPQHLEAIQPHVRSGLLVLGGASLAEPLQDGVPPKITGSVLMAEADSQDEVWDLVKNDVYYKEGIWDAEKIRIFPFKSAVRQSL